MWSSSGSVALELLECLSGPGSVKNSGGVNSDCGGEFQDVSRSVSLRAQTGERSVRFELGGGEDERHGGRVDAVAGGYVGEVPGASIGARAVAEEGR